MLLLNKVIYIRELIPIPVDSRLFPAEQSPVDSGRLRWTPFSGLQSTLFYFIPVDSSKLRWNHHVTICDISGVRSSPLDSGESSGFRRRRWGSVKYCQVSLLFMSFFLLNDICRYHLCFICTEAFIEGNNNGIRPKQRDTHCLGHL